MKRLPVRLRAALACSGAGFLLAAVCLISTTPVTMLLFAGVGVPAFGAGFGLYLLEVLADLRRHGIL